MKKMLVCVIAHVSSPDTVACIASLKKLSYDTMRILFIDNGSADNAGAQMGRLHPDVEVVRKEENCGAAGGRNIAVSYALRDGWDYLFFVDNDAIVEPDTLARLVEAAEADERFAAVGAMSYYASEPKRVWHFGGRMNWIKGVFEDTCQGEEDKGQFAGSRECDSFPIGFGIVRVDAIRKVGPLDERFFIYHEEADWHARMKRAGYRLAVTPRAKIYHKVSQSVGMETPAFYYYRTRNRLLFMWKNAPRLALAAFFFYFLYDFLFVTMLTLLLNGKRPHMRAALFGVGDFLRGRFGKCPYAF